MISETPEEANQLVGMYRCLASIIEAEKEELGVLVREPKLG